MSLRKVRLLALLGCFALPVVGQIVPKDPAPDTTEIRLPNGKLQKEEILKADHEKSLEDAAKLVQLTEELKIELEKNDRHILAVSTLKKLEEVEKLTKRIRSRLRRY
jgi:hypothetical protein